MKLGDTRTGQDLFGGKIHLLYLPGIELRFTERLPRSLAITPT